jgi:hypothetical protein
LAYQLSQPTLAPSISVQAPGEAPDLRNLIERLDHALAADGNLL